MTIHFFIFTIRITRNKKDKMPMNNHHNEAQEQLLSRKATYRNLY
ncbi:hypothetical protein GCM10010954_16490 [Halobacillus andaensis]|uniref:Uncharacterized protein n=1 Tax=Halobacillus andaensis TaxID=1176239 RepID=A0A917B4M4_HALAA|nr:YrzI family small protein [Halobacillus andaensis]MBP2004849.1 hypothetical protein [Halobacillus andaensis]GGF18438.1 hypothetical protein GCM10010954_16490 [Halobacillus andaensis]